MVKKAIFLKHGRLAPPRFPSGQIERHEETACPTGFSSRCITHRSSFFQTRPRLLSTRRRGAEKKGNGRRVYEKKRPVIEVFSLESSTYACYSTRTSRCVASSRRNTKKTSNVVPAIPLCRYILSSLEKCSLACVVFAEEIVSSRWRGSNFFFLPYSSLPTSVRIVSFKHSGSTFCICLILKKGMLNQFF